MPHEDSRPHLSAVRLLVDVGPLLICPYLGKSWQILPWSGPTAS